jgi:hypothetical protein
MSCFFRETTSFIQVFRHRRLEAAENILRLGGQVPRPGGEAVFLPLGLLEPGVCRGGDHGIRVGVPVADDVNLFSITVSPVSL